MRLWRLLVMLPAFLLVSQGAWCAGIGAKQVEGFIGAMQELKPYFDQYADEAEDDGDATSTSRLMGDWARSLKDQREVEAMLKKHGFDVESWSEVSQQVTQAYMAVKLGRRATGCELKPSYWRTAVANLRQLDSDMSIPSLLDLIETL